MILVDYCSLHIGNLFKDTTLELFYQILYFIIDNVLMSTQKKGSVPQCTKTLMRWGTDPELRSL